MPIYPNTSGIYGWINTINGKWLVGSTNNFQERFIYHRSYAVRNVHPNPHFQSS